MKSSYKVAEEIAEQIKADPVAARRIKEFFAGDTALMDALDVRDAELEERLAREIQDLETEIAELRANR